MTLVDGDYSVAILRVDDQLAQGRPLQAIDRLAPGYPVWVADRGRSDAEISCHTAGATSAIRACAERRLAALAKQRSLSIVT